MSEQPVDMPASKKPKLEHAPVEAVPVPMSSIRETILSRWTRRVQDEFWNVYLVFDDCKELLCSRSDLCLMSPYFAAMFEGEFAESARTRIAITGTESSAMEQMIESYYTGKLRVSEDTCRAIATAADMYQFQHVSEACQQFLKEKLSAASAIETLNLAREIPSLSPLLPAVVSNIRDHIFQWLFREKPMSGFKKHFYKLSMPLLIEILLGVELKREAHKLIIITYWRYCRDKAGVEQWNTPSPDCLMNLVDFSCFTANDVRCLMNLPMYNNILRDEGVMRRLMEHCVAAWSASESNGGGGRQEKWVRVAFGKPLPA